MLVGHCIQEPLDILLGADYTRQAKDLDWGIIGVYTHVHVVLLTGRHDGLQEVFHVGTQLRLVNAFVQVQEITELLDGSLVVLAEVSAHESLGLDDDGLNQLVLTLGGHGLGQSISLGQNVAALTYSCRELELCPLLTCALALKYIDVKVGKFSVIEIEVGGSVGVDMEQVRTGPIQHRHEVVANAVDTFGR